MGELSDLFAIYGAIDHEVMEHPEHGRRVSKLLPVYQRRPEVHWFDDFAAWAVEKGAEDPRSVSLDDALRGLAEADDALRGHAEAEDPPSGRTRARRLFAIAVAAQAFPELRDPDSERAALARGALRVESLAEDDERAGRLLMLLGDESMLPLADDPGARDAWWDELLASELIDPETLGHRPCSGRLVMVPGIGGPVATLETEFETVVIDFDRATRFLEPSNWPRCSDFWCIMDRQRITPAGVHQYHEVVSIDCPRRPRSWTIQAELDFTFREGDDVAMTDYSMTRGVPQPDVLVDEGSLVVRRIPSAAGEKLRIKTTKRIKFNHAFSGEALAMMMCALGYATVAEDLVFTCGASGDKEPGTPFPGRPLTTDETNAEPETAPRSARMEGGRPDPSLAQDMAAMWMRALREGARALDLGLRSARRAAPPTRDRETPAS